MLIYFQTCIIIQEIFAEGVVAKDARLRVGDQILEVYFKIKMLKTIRFLNCIQG